jgi:hypothetical protein
MATARGFSRRAMEGVRPLASELEFIIDAQSEGSDPFRFMALRPGR